MLKSNIDVFLCDIISLLTQICTLCLLVLAVGYIVCCTLCLLVLAVGYIVCCTLCLVSIFARIHIWSNVDFSV